MTFPQCERCYKLAGVPCEHRLNYQLVEISIKGQKVNGENIVISEGNADPYSKYYEPPEKYWKAGKCLMRPPTILMWPSAHTMYGWDTMTSVLIHEFGHLNVYEAKGSFGEGLEAEDNANRYDFWHIPERERLIPRNYWLNREFFLPSSLCGGWTEEICRREYEKWKAWMKDAPMVRALAIQRA